MALTANRKGLSLNLDRLRRETFHSLPEMDATIEGPEQADDLLGQLVSGWEKEVKELGVKEGRAQILSEFRERAEKKLFEYFSRVFAVKETVQDLSDKMLSGVQIKEARANLCPLSGELNFFFIIEAEKFEDDLDFATLISQIQQALLKEAMIYCEILYASKPSDSELDVSSIKADYPFLLKAR